MGTIIGTRRENRENGNGNGNGGTEDATGTENRNGASTPSSDRTPFQSYMLNNRDKIIYFGARSCIVLLGILYLILALAQDYYYSFTTYYLIFLIACVVNISRFYSRYSLTNIPFFSKQFLQYAMLDGAFLSFCYSFLFLKSYPTLPLAIPVILTALINMAMFARSTEQLLSPDKRANVNKFHSTILSRQDQIRSVSAMCEILAFPITLMHMTSGHASILQPFIYFTFLKLRVMSGSNPHILQHIQAFEMMCTNLANHTLCPALLSRVIRACIYYVSKICSVPLVQNQ